MPVGEARWHDTPCPSISGKQAAWSRVCCRYRSCCRLHSKVLINWTNSTVNSVYLPKGCQATGQGSWGLRRCKASVQTSWDWPFSPGHTAYREMRNCESSRWWNARENQNFWSNANSTKAWAVRSSFWNANLPESMLACMQNPCRLLSLLLKNTTPTVLFPVFYTWPA